MGLSWLHSVVSNMDSGDWILLGLLFLNGVTLGFTAWWIRRQARTTDLKSYLQLREQFSSSWRKFRDAEEHNKDFEFVEVLSLLEAASHLYNQSIFYGATKKMVGSYLLEVIKDVFKNEYAKKQFLNSRSSPTTYSEILNFAKSQRIEEVEETFRQAEKSNMD